MSKKFPYKYDVNVYLNKAFKKILYTYFWAKKDMLDERYEFRRHELGSYSVFVQAGDRTTGASRTFYILQDYFKGTYEDFLNKYCKLVPSNFGFTKDELLNIKGLKEFLNF